MDTQIPKHIQDCYIHCDKSRNILYKYCIRPDLYSIYADGFRQEYDSMKALEQKDPATYADYFPHYYSVSTSKKEAPYISMEHIDGISLEYILTEKRPLHASQPTFLFSYKQISYICSQVFHALCFLCANNIFYFDLLPRNIIVENQNCDIKLIDFTFCYHVPFQENRCYKKMDHRLNHRLPLPLRIEHALMLFFTRLFYCGEPCYDEYFHPHASTRDMDFFHQNFGALLHSLLDASEEELESLIEDFSRPSANTAEACCLRLQSWHYRLQEHLGRLEPL